MFVTKETVNCCYKDVCYTKQVFSPVTLALQNYGFVAFPETLNVRSADLVYASETNSFRNVQYLLADKQLDTKNILFLWM